MSEAAAMRQEYSAAREIWKKFRRNKTAMLGLAAILFLCTVAIFAPLIANGKTLLVFMNGSLSSPAFSAMLRAGATRAATGENAAIVACREAEVIVGPIGIVVADALLGEVTPRMAAAVGQSLARKVLIPVNQCGNVVVGVPSGATTAQLVAQAVEAILHPAEGDAKS